MQADLPQVYRFLVNPLGTTNSFLQYLHFNFFLGLAVCARR